MPELVHDWFQPRLHYVLQRLADHDAARIAHDIDDLCFLVAGLSGGKLRQKIERMIGWPMGLIKIMTATAANDTISILINLSRADKVVKLDGDGSVDISWAPGSVSSAFTMTL